MDAPALNWAPTKYRPVEPDSEYARVACESGEPLWRRYHEYLAERGMTDALPLEIAFLETVGDEPDVKSIAKAGFYSHDSPYRIYLVVDKCPADELEWWVRHEVAHAIQFLLQGAASAGPRGEALADEMAGPDVPAGHAEALALTADRLVVYPPDWLVAEILPAIGSGSETLALPAVATGLTVTGGQISVRNPGGTVIIDGSSDMLKVATKGFLSSATGPNNNTVVLQADYPNGLTSAPAHAGFSGFQFGQLPYINLNYLNWTQVADQIQLDTTIVSTNQTRVKAAYTSAYNRSGTPWRVDFFIFKEAVI
jgi:hypothetical protein